MTQPKIVIGSIVQLKSGGCNMTVKSLFKDVDCQITADGLTDMAICVFFDGEGRFYETDFPLGVIASVASE